MDIYILDTNILLADPLLGLTYLFSDMGDCKIVIIKSVLDELDTIKIKDDGFGYQAREASRGLETLLLNSQKTDDGWEISPGYFLVIDEEIELKLPKNVHQKTCDDKLLASTVIYADNHEKNAVWLVSLDRNLRVRAEAMNLNWINPAAWLPIDTNTYYFPFASHGLRWSQNEDYSSRLPINMENDGTCWVDVYPYWGYQSGDFSTLHIQFFDPDYETENIAPNASRLLILSSENKIRYRDKMKNMPYKVIFPKDGQNYSLIHKKWKINVGITRVEISEPISDQNKVTNNALLNISLGVSNVGKSSLLSGMLLGSGIRTMRAIARNAPFFSQLGFSIQVSLASNEEIKQDRHELKAEYKQEQTKKRQNTITILVILAIVFGLPAMVAAFCMLSLIIGSR
jgi:hypothetical protein